MAHFLISGSGCVATHGSASSRVSGVPRRVGPPRQAGVAVRLATRRPMATELRRTGRVLAAKETETTGKETEATPPTDSQQESQNKEQKQEFAQEEIAAMVAERRAAKSAAASSSSSNPLSGALEEARLIIWPGVGEALVNTVVVIGIVFVTAAMLFAVNTGLAKLSNVVYEKPASEAAPSEGAGSQPSAAPAEAAPAVETEEPVTSNIPKTL